MDASTDELERARSDDAGPRAERPGRVSSAERLTHGVILAIAVAVPAFAAVMTTLAGERVAFAGFERFPLPSLCLSRSLGVPCPTCGVTRSVIALVAGDLAGSLAHHRLGWLMFGLIVTQIPWRAYRLMRPDAPHPRLERAGIAAAAAVAAAVLIERAVRLF